ncbi:MAG: nitroreductase, partial [Gammaproteobacteria bacterium]|nr:nitroreductase [Gammaproteobacteria bacterium]NIR81607.1 nitroreductase [Gammaproteobacteria bacterium]NIU02719.1 nitroreductase [Gammaproteobacteria bacterium]NIV50300.1 nitroreductase [Gammaproteobacteria bacterium]NIX83994.1 nitroreductase [Gammaproteobacteria bacterium]
SWAERAPVLIASAYKTHFTRNDKPNPSALRDLGAAEENMFLQTYAEGLVMHQMAGFDRARLKAEL